MRYREFALFENPIDTGEDLSSYVEDDADHEADNALIDVLRRIQFSGAKMPKITVAALLNLVKNEPGGEAFDKNALEKAKSNNEAVKELIKNIEADNNGIEYVFLKPPEPVEGELGQDGAPADSEKSANIVSSMASRAAKN
jgi:hypothetical protein